MKFSKKLTAAAAIVAAGFASNAAAETATDTVDVYAGLQAVLEMTCSDVNFGVWRVPTGDRGGSTTVTLDESGNVSATVTSGGAADNGVANDDDKFDAPAAGTCNVTGSTVSDADGAASITTGGSGTFLGTNSNPFATGLEKPDALPPGSAFSFTLSLSTATPAIDANGEATFQVVGSMEIPNNLVSDNYGAYISEGSSTVLFDDAPVEQAI